jgi:hypothetical protein
MTRLGRALGYALAALLLLAAMGAAGAIEGIGS